MILGAKLCLLSVKKRLNHRDPHVVLLALSLLDSLWSNCGITFRREVSSREFSQELSFKATHVSCKYPYKHETELMSIMNWLQIVSFLLIKNGNILFLISADL